MPSSQSQYIGKIKPREPDHFLTCHTELSALVGSLAKRGSSIQRQSFKTKPQPICNKSLQAPTAAKGSVLTVLVKSVNAAYSYLKNRIATSCHSHVVSVKRSSGTESQQALCLPLERFGMTGSQRTLQRKLERSEREIIWSRLRKRCCRLLSFIASIV